MLDAKNIKEGKVQNIAITLDKVKHVLERMNTSEPPLRPLTCDEVYQRLWVGPDSVRETLVELLQKIEGDVDSACDFILAVDFDPEEGS